MFPMIIKAKTKNPRSQRPQYDGRRVNIPGWLTDPDLPAPCICGQPLMPNQPHIMGEGELGMKRWFHMACWNLMMQEDDGWEDEDEDEDEWELS